MWFIIFCICIVFLGLMFRASNPKKKHVKQNIKETKPQLLSDQIDERLRIKKRGKFDSKTERNSIRKVSRKPLKSCGTRSSIDPIGRNGNNAHASSNEIGPFPNSSGYMTRKQLSYYFSHLEGEMFTDYLLAASDNSLIKVNELDFATMLKKKTDYDKFSKDLNETANNNNIGIDFEKKGNIPNAIEAYERNLEIAYPALHSYERLMILYRREKRYEDEIRVIEKAINDFSTKSHKTYISKWKERLKKAQSLNEK